MGYIPRFYGKCAFQVGKKLNPEAHLLRVLADKFIFRGKS
jgi:hypothetical protein